MAGLQRLGTLEIPGRERRIPPPGRAPRARQGGARTGGLAHPHYWRALLRRPSVNPKIPRKFGKNYSKICLTRWHLGAILARSKTIPAGHRCSARTEPKRSKMNTYETEWHNSGCLTLERPSVDFIKAVAELLETDAKDLLSEMG